MLYRGKETSGRLVNEAISFISEKAFHMKKNYTFFTLLFFLGHLSLLFGQGDNLLDDDAVHEIHLTFNDSSFWNTLTGNYDNNYPDVPYIMANAVIDGTAVDSIGVRLKGFSSYWVATDKKSIKLDFNEFVSGKKYDGLKKINLNNGEGDPAVQRDKLCYDIMRKSGVSAPRTAYTKVFLNGEYWGLYLLVEQIDQTFINQNFDNEEGNLFKNMANSNLDWLGPDTTAYQQIFELKSGNPTDAWARFVNLMDVINNSSDADFKDAINEVFDVNLYLKVLAVDVATNNWDSYIEHGRNFYMYEDPVSKKFKWIPWDYNLSMGGAFSSFGGPGGSGGEIEDPSACLTITNGSCPYPPTDTIFIQVINQDPFCCNTDWDGVCQDAFDDILNGGGGSNPGGGPGFGNFPIDMSNSQKVLINRLLAVPEFQDKYYQYWCGLLDDNMTIERLFPMIDTSGNLIRDAIYADSNYMWTTENFEEDLDQGNNNIPGLKKFLEERIIDIDSQLNVLFDCNSLNSILAFQDITINEFMASNDSLSGIADANGEYDDWIELYNNTTTSIDLSNTYLSDKADNPQKWAFPTGTTIEAESYLIVWADNDEGQDGLHANFKLSKSGDFILLSDFNSPIDSIRFEEQETNSTASRIPNGTGDFIIKNPTYNDNNENVTATEDLLNAETSVRFFPNPAKEFVNVVFDENPETGTVINIYNNVGQRLLRQEISEARTTVGLQNLTPGIYILVIDNKQGQRVSTKKLIVY